MLLNRSGWQYRVSYQQLINALGLQERDNIELKAEVTVYPEGEGALVFPNFDSNLSLPLSYKKQGQETSFFWQSDTRTVMHQNVSAISSRSVVLDNRSLYQYHHYGF